MLKLWKMIGDVHDLCPQRRVEVVAVAVAVDVAAAVATPTVVLEHVRVAMVMGWMLLLP
jgi:hypothetical protein